MIRTIKFTIYSGIISLLLSFPLVIPVATYYALNGKDADILYNLYIIILISVIYLYSFGNIADKMENCLWIML